MNRQARLATASFGALAVAAAHVSPVIALMPSGRQIFPVLSRIEGASTVALTFDDGPDNSTESVMRILGDHRATATFFVLGEQVERSPSLIRDMLAAGHEIGLHGYRHRHHLRLTPGQVSDDLARGKATVEDATGRKVTLYRAPHGIFSLASWREAGRQGWHRVLWSRSGHDWRADATSDSIVERIGEPQGGDIILLHDSARYSSPGRTKVMLGALPRVLERIEKSGLQTRSIGSMLVSHRQ